MQIVWRRRWTRWHLTLGLVLAPYLIVVGVSAVLLNHSAWWRPVDVEWQREAVGVDPAAPALRATAHRDALGLFGTVPPARIVLPERPDGPFVFRIVRPGRVYDVEWFEHTASVRVRERRGGWAGVLRLLHGMTELPGSWIGPVWGAYSYLALVGLPILVVSGLGLDLARWRRQPRVAWQVAAASLVVLWAAAWLTGP
jgi:hypothetical protein